MVIASSSSYSTSRNWSDLNCDLLVSIFSRVNSIDKIAGVSSVCSAWRSAARNQHCWRVVDFSDWDYVASRVDVRVDFNKVFNRVLGFVNGGGECIEELYFPPGREDDEHDLLVSDRLPKLRYLSYPKSEMAEMALYSTLVNFKSLKGIAVNYHFLVTTKVLTLSSTQFPEISELKLHGEISSGDNLVIDIINMVCKLFPKLKKLEMQESFSIEKGVILMLLNKLQNLEYLDISGCKTLSAGSAPVSELSPCRIDERVFEKAASRLKVFILAWNKELERIVESFNWNQL